MRRRVTVFSIALLSAGCTVGPDYKRPKLAVPNNFRAPAGSPLEEGASIGDLRWFEIFGDKTLQGLIRTALTNNFDLRDAVARVEQARANLGVTRSNQYPNLSSSGGVQVNRLSRDGQTALRETILPSQNRNFGSASLGLLSFEIDIWGKLRRATEAARANLLSAEENRKAVITTMVSEVATGYLTLCELDYELEISLRTLRTREQSLELTRSRQRGGVGTLLDVRQAEQLVDTAAQTIPGIRRQIESTENRINLLLGRSPDGVPRERCFGAAILPPEVPSGIPSRLLERRPDIRAAEQDLIAANANIGIARAAYLPQLTLTGFLGGQSTQLTNLFAGPQSAWSLAPQLTRPIFTAGRLKSNVRLTEATRERALAQYEKAIQTAFAEVSDALIARERVRESRTSQESLVTTLQDRVRLAYLRYRGGVDTQLNALDADRDLFSAELALARIRLEESLTVVQLYKALGGGWQ